MDLVFTAEHDALRAAARELLTRHAQEQAVRAVMETETGYDPSVWHRMAQEVGLQGLAVPEALGGAGAGVVEIGVVMEVLGRALYCGPFLSSAVLAANALLGSGDDIAARKYLPDIGAGSVLATVADHSLLAGAAQPMPVATPGLTGVRIEGHVGYVLDGHIADVFVVTAVDGGEPGMYLVEAPAADVVTTSLPTMDATRKIAAVEFRGAVAQRLGAPGNARRDGQQVVAVEASALRPLHRGVPARSRGQRHGAV